MSHELRTPLNSLLVLAKLLVGEPGRQPDRTSRWSFARTIHAAGSDLLQLINDILDLSKVEAGKMDVNPRRSALSALVDYVDATFRPMADDKGLSSASRCAPGTPDRLYTDEQRLAADRCGTCCPTRSSSPRRARCRLRIGRAGRRGVRAARSAEHPT